MLKVVYCTGGHEDWTWRKIFGLFADKEQAAAKRDYVSRMGFAAIVIDEHEEPPTVFIPWTQHAA